MTQYTNLLNSKEIVVKMLIELHEETKRCNFVPPGSNSTDRSSPTPSSRRTCWPQNKMADSSRTGSTRTDPGWAALGHRGCLSGDRRPCRRAFGRSCTIRWDSSSCHMARMVRMVRIVRSSCHRIHTDHPNHTDHMTRKVHKVRSQVCMCWGKALIGILLYASLYPSISTLFANKPRKKCAK